MPQTLIPAEVKKACCDMKTAGKTTVEIYETYFKMECSSRMSLETFSRKLRQWSQKVYPSSDTLHAGTYKGFVAHDATVQVSADGEITQAWIKQKATDMDPEDFIKAVSGSVEKFPYVLSPKDDSYGMLEVPLFDMHWGVAFMDYYESTLTEIVDLIYSHPWKKVVIPFGQDFFHNDSIAKGETTKGTPIEKIDMIRAVKEGQRFVYAIADAAIANADMVSIIYTPGNHDRSTAWMFMQTLMERYGQEIVDDSLENRKVITYGKNAIMITHGDSKRATPSNLAHIFSTSFPEEFAKSNVREIHAGHLHSEADTDVFGVMVRRVSSKNKTDDWSDIEDYVGANKRFMLFDWNNDKLRSIHYV